ncbi:hypothetical protein PHLGIDRAFT_415724 [Phlebiopsis gigantea 11061_1 CR5-6]|uniref:Uncharacterized protein n=1 Tax=Phlebiopsis gigantea (strain 11061_1 CR5-6) TaxID=745531 RepID=A0A0C3S8K8_PHLG1|nr:hypothetical protein PHLGIDRAFT_415724 [Phlebiopsis gigantea 11061_1 CR5-6]
MSNISNVASSLLTGLTVSLFMYGVATAQTCYYFSHYSSDPTRLKSRVTVLWILSTTFIILLTLSVYMDVILQARTGYLSPTITWTVPIYLAYVTSLSTASLVQIDLLFKIHKLNSPKWRLPVSCLLGCAILTRLGTFSQQLVGVKTSEPFDEAFGIVAMRTLGKEFLSPADVHLSQSHHPVIDKESPFN